MSVAYEEDALSDEAQVHLEQCPICQKRLADYQRTNATLRSKLYMRLCPDAIDLNYYCLGGLPVEERTRIASHLLDCVLCADEIASMRRLQSNFDPFPDTQSPLSKTLCRLFAVRVLHQMQPVTRNDLFPTEWPHYYHTETIDLSLHLSRSLEGEMMLIGIVTSTKPEVKVNAFEGGTVELYQALVASSESGREGQEIAKGLVSTHIDDVGGILLEPIPDGNYTMSIRLPNQEIVIEGLDIHSV